LGQALVQLAILLENAGGCRLKVICANAQQISHSGLRKLLSVDAEGRGNTPQTLRLNRIQLDGYLHNTIIPLGWNRRKGWILDAERPPSPARNQQAQRRW